MTSGRRGVHRGDKIVLGIGRYVEMVLEVQQGIREMPIGERGARKKGGTTREILKSRNNQWIGQQGRGYFIDKSSINGTNKQVIRENGNINIVRRSVMIR